VFGFCGQQNNPASSSRADSKTVVSPYLGKSRLLIKLVIIIDKIDSDTSGNCRSSTYFNYVWPSGD
jgi:hypothetical protein